MHRFMILLSILILLGWFTLNTSAQTTSGRITGDEEWSGEILITGDVMVAGGGRLTILPGTVVKAQPDADDQESGLDPALVEIIVDGGMLTANGTEAKPIRFTSDGTWYGIRLLRGALSLKYCDQNAGVIGLSVEGAVPQAVENCVFGGNSDKGLLLQKSFKLVSCHVEGNGTTGIFCETGGRAQGCEINFNGGDGISGVGDIKIEQCNITFNGGAGVDTTGSVQLTGCSVSFNGGHGVNANSTVTVDTCDITDNGGSGIRAAGGAQLDISEYTTNSASVSDSTVSNNIGTGIEVIHSATASSSGGRHNRNTVNVSNTTIALNGAEGIKVSGNAASASWSCGYSCTTSTARKCYNEAYVSDAIVTENGRAGVSVSGNASFSYKSGHQSYNTGTLIRCTISGNSGRGVEVFGTVNDSDWETNNVIINSCMVQGKNAGEGIYVQGYAAVVDSVITDNRGAGISLIGVKGFLKNQIFGNAVGVQILDAASGTVQGITDNDILDNTTHELENTSPAEVVADNNYWGEPTTTELSTGVINLSKIYECLDNPTVGCVVIDTYLDESHVSHDRPNIRGEFTLVLPSGLSMVSLPVDIGTAYMASQLATDFNATLVIRLDNATQQFLPFLPGFSLDEEDFPLLGGEGYIVNVESEQQKTFTGVVWRNTTTAAPIVPLQSNASAWAFAVAGQVAVSSHSNESLRVTVVHPRTGWEAMQPLSPAGGPFAVAVADLARHSVIESGDVLQLRVEDASGHLLHRQDVPVMQDELAQARILLPPFTVNTRPQSTHLLPNFPNPFNPETWIPYTLAEGTEVKVHIYNMRGQGVRTIDLGYRPAGWYDTRASAVYWDGRNTSGERISSGNYWVVMEAGTTRSTRRLVVAK